MPITDPRNLNERYNELFRERDLDGMLSLYEENAILCPVPGQQVKGRIEIRKRLGGLIALKGTLVASEQSCVEFENCALLHAHWQFNGTTPDGNPVAMGGTSTKLARRGRDGCWRYVLDMPLGGSIHRPKARALDEIRANADPFALAQIATAIFQNDRCAFARWSFSQATHVARCGRNRYDLWAAGPESKA